MFIEAIFSQKFVFSNFQIKIHFLTYFQKQTRMSFENRFLKTHRKYFQHRLMFFRERYLIKPFYEKRNENNIEIKFHDVDKTKFCGTLIINRTIISTVSKISFAFVKKTIVVIMLTIIAVVSKNFFTTF